MKKMAFFIAVCFLLPLLCGTAHAPNNNGLFCWDGGAVEDEGRDELFDAMEDAGLTVLYQYFSDDHSKDCIRGFLRDAAERGIRVYYLAGEPEWGLDPEGEEMLAQVRRADKINKKLPEQARLRGVMMDTEPYLTDRWDGREEEVMGCFSAAMAAVRESAEEKGLECMLCIPFYYDDDVAREQLAELIGSGCHGLAIMNYSKKDEAEQIRTEMALADGKPVTVVYELQEPGSHGLKEHNTYHNEGIEGVEKSFQALREIYGQEGFSYALHDYRALKELNEHE